MTFGQLLLATAALLGLLAAAPVWRAASERRAELRLLLAASPLTAACALAILIGMLLAIPGDDRSAAFLASSARLAAEGELYPGREAGVLLGWSAGPVPAVLFAPAALVRDLRASLLAAGITNLLCVVVPLAVVFQRRARGERGLAFAFCASTAAALLLVEGELFASLAAEGLACGLALCSCAALLRRAGEPGGHRLSLAALLFVLAAGSSPAAVPAVVGQLVWLGLAFGRRAAARYFLSLLLFVVLGAAVAHSLFGLPTLWRELFAIPPDEGMGPGARSAATLLPFLLAIAWVHHATRRAGVQERPLAREWGLFLLAGAAPAATGLLARSGLGPLAVVFLIVAAGLALRSSVTAESGASLRLERSRALVALVLCLAVLPMLPFEHALSASPADPAPALAFSRAHPHEVLFAANPLITWKTDGRLYHVERAVDARTAAGRAPSREQLYAHLPEHLRYLVRPRPFPGAPDEPALLERLPELERRDELDWPGVTVYERASPERP